MNYQTLTAFSDGLNLEASVVFLTNIDRLRGSEKSERSRMRIV